MLPLVYGTGLLLAALLSERSHRTILSSAALFVGLGFLAGPAALGLIDLDPGAALVGRVSDIALFTILFSDGLRLGLTDLRRAWHLPGRALIIGMPLTWILIAAAARLLFDLPWVHALLVGAALSPTDPVFASAIVGRQEIPARVRQLLNVESGLNDGLALPAVISLLALADHEPFEPAVLIAEAAGGIALGVAVAFAAGLLRRLPVFAVIEVQAPLVPLAIGFIVFGAAQVAQVNEYLAAFAAGVALASVSPASRDEFREVGERLGEALKLAAVLMLIVMLSGLPADLTTRNLLFVAAVLVVARAVAIVIALAGSGLTWPERFVAAWFGPKGFASVIYGLMILRANLSDRELLFELVAVVIVSSILLHSSTDVLIARYFENSRSSR